MSVRLSTSTIGSSGIDVFWHAERRFARVTRSMAVSYGTVVAGQSVSSAFTLAATDKELLIAVSSHAALSWFAAFQVTPGGPFVRDLDSWSANSQNALLASAVGGIGLIGAVPAQVMRIETNNAVSATTSFTLIEHAGR
jgi:hypothetical protein